MFPSPILETGKKRMFPGPICWFLYVADHTWTYVLMWHLEMLFIKFTPFTAINSRQYSFPIYMYSTLGRSIIFFNCNLVIISEHKVNSFNKDNILFIHNERIVFLHNVKVWLQGISWINMFGYRYTTAFYRYTTAFYRYTTAFYRSYMLDAYFTRFKKSSVNSERPLTPYSHFNLFLI